MTRRPATFVPALLLTVALGTLTACGSDSSSSESSSESPDGSATPSGSSSASASQEAGGSGGSTFCDAVTDDTATSAVAFNPVIPGVSTGGTASIENRLAFIDGTQAPEGLEAEWETYRTYLQAVDPDTFAPAGDEVDQARDALFDASLECRG